jgi:hemin uptake protein HemP
MNAPHAPSAPLAFTPSLPPSTAPANDRPPRLSSRALLGDRPEVEILHGDQIYRLRRTALGKLILTK